MENREISVRFGDKIIFDRFRFNPEENKITCILGPSGSGKTTLLKVFAGLIPQNPKVYAGKCSMIFQDHRLLPNLTARDNLAIVLSGKRKEKREKANRLLNDMELADAANLYPSELSGGMAQRVAIARALIYPSPLLLMDEPFKGLDLALQERLIRYFIKYWENEKRTAIFVTHSILEAILVADRIVVLKNGEKGAEVVFDRAFEMPRKDRALGDPKVDELRSDLHSVLVSL